MENLGSLALILALAMACIGTISSIIAGVKARERFRKVAVRSYVIATLLVFVAVAVLAYMLQTDQFNLVYIYGHSNRALPWYFKLTALWGGGEGSLLWWTLILMVYTCIFLFFTRKAPRLMMSWALFFVGLTLVFFLVINNFVKPPFNIWAQHPAGLDPVAFTPNDGRGLNPQLQHWAMIIHPPMLYTGYIGFLFPFAIALGALITRLEGRVWIRLIRNWTLTAWMILGAGIILGGAWAYMELGWGGYWAWDPVENASFMPWLLATAFIHSVMAQEKRGMFKLWNILLLVATYLMCIVGTGITRSGLISSVHAFAESNIGYYFFAYLVIHGAIVIMVLISRRDQLKDDNAYKHASSREVGLLFNNVLFLAITVAMFLGTIWPMITEWLNGVKQEVRHGYYNNVELPLFLMLMLMMAIGPVLTWKKTSDRLLRERFLIPGILGLVALVGAFMMWGMRPYPVISTGVLTFLGITILHEFVEVVGRRVKRAGENPVTALASVVRMNKRRYGGYMAHLGMLMIAIGITGAAFNDQDKQSLGIGETMTVGGFTFQVADLSSERNELYEALVADVNLIKNGKVVRTFHPEQRFYFASEMQASEVDIWVTPQRDYYVVIAGLGDGHLAEHPVGAFHVYVNPLVLWVWFGGILLTLSTFLSMLPDKVRVAARQSVPAGEPA